MLRRTFYLSLLVFGNASAFVVNTGFGNSIGQQRFSLSSELKLSSAPTSSSAPEGMLPEYQNAYNHVSAVISSFVGSTKNDQLLNPLLHFCKEYLTASQTSFLKTRDERSTPSAAQQRIMESVQFGLKYGMGPEKFTFGVTHHALRGNPEAENGNTLDFYTWGCDFFRTFMDMENSKVLGMENLKKAMDQANAGENVVFFANHQSEADPQVMSCLLEHVGLAKEAEKVFYVAGHKVTTDALAIPFSMGRNLICIHSKKHIDKDPETKSLKSRQNLSAMNGMLEKLKAGGTILWVAPSGGRDRRDVTTGKTPIAPFDDKTLDMFRLMGTKSKKPTHYYPLAMVSYELCPPPDSVEPGVGEQRNFRFGPVGIQVGEELPNEGGLESRPKFNGEAMNRTLKAYHELREAIYPGTAPDLP